MGENAGEIEGLLSNGNAGEVHGAVDLTGRGCCERNSPAKSDRQPSTSAHINPMTMAPSAAPKARQNRSLFHGLGAQRAATAAQRAQVGTGRRAAATQSCNRAEPNPSRPAGSPLPSPPLPSF